MVNSHLYNQQEEEINYKKLLFTYLINKWYVYVFFIGLFVGLTHYFVSKSTPVYEISAKLKIKEKENDYSSEDDWLRRNLNMYTVSENVNNEVEVLSAFSLMHDVVRELDLSVSYEVKDESSIRSIYNASPIIVDTFSLNAIEDPTFEIIPIDDDRFLFFQDTAIGRYRFGQLFTNDFGTFRINKVDEIIIRNDYSYQITFQDLRYLAQSFLGSFEVEFSDDKQQSSILILTLLDAIPERGVDVLNMLVEKYGELKHRENNELALNTLKFINERLNNVKSELNWVESDLVRYKMSNDIASQSTSDLDLMLQKTSDLSEERKDLEVQIDIIKQMRANTENDLEGNFELINENISSLNNQIQTMVNSYNDMVLRRKNLLVNGKESNPLIQSLTRDLSTLKSTILEALINLQNDLELQLEGVMGQHENVADRLSSVPTKEKQLGDKTRKQTITQDLYLYLLKKKEETTLSLVSSYANSNLIDPPRSSLDPVAPKKKRMYVLGFSGGLAISFLLIFLIEFFKDEISTIEEVRYILPENKFVATVCHAGKRGAKVAFRQGKTPVSEYIRTLRANLQFHFQEPQKTILVTSCSSSEGKSFVASNLAASYAHTDKKTVILDFDLHKPDLDTYFEENSEVGLSDYFAGDASLENIIGPLLRFPKLDYISSGPVHPYPSELISDEKLEALFRHLKKEYDIIIIDTPPVGIIADALLLNKYINVSLFVVRSGFTSKEMIKKVRDLLKKEVLPNPVIILNGIKEKNSSYKYYFKKNAI